MTTHHRRRFVKTLITLVVGLGVIAGIWWMTYALFAPTSEQTVSHQPQTPPQDSTTIKSKQDLDNASSALGSMDVDDKESTSLQQDAGDF